MHLYTNPAQGYLTDDVMTAAEALFDEAEAAVKDDATLLERVRVARMPLVYAKSFPRNGYKIDDGKLVFQGPLATLDEVQEFVDRMKRHGFGTIREHGGDPAQLIAAGRPLPRADAARHAPQRAPASRRGAVLGRSGAADHRSQDGPLCHGLQHEAKPAIPLLRRRREPRRRDLHDRRGREHGPGHGGPVQRRRPSRS